jgi:hypothetical protein
VRHTQPVTKTHAQQTKPSDTRASSLGPPPAVSNATTPAHLASLRMQAVMGSRVHQACTAQVLASSTQLLQTPARFCTVGSGSASVSGILFFPAPCLAGGCIPMAPPVCQHSAAGHADGCSKCRVSYGALKHPHHTRCRHQGGWSTVSRASMLPGFKATKQQCQQFVTVGRSNGTPCMHSFLTCFSTTDGRGLLSPAPTH